MSAISLRRKRWSFGSLAAASASAFTRAGGVPGQRPGAVPPEDLSRSRERPSQCDPHWRDEQIFGADEQVPGRGQSDEEGFGYVCAERAELLMSLRSA